MDSELFMISAGISGLIGSLAPFVLPSIFTLLSKIYKKDLVASEKRLVITLLSVLVALILIAARFEWNGDLKADMGNFIQLLFINFVAIKAMVQVIYEMIIKSIPALEERFS